MAKKKQMTPEELDKAMLDHSTANVKERELEESLKHTSTLDQLVYKEINHKGVKVLIELDYRNKRVSFVDYNGSTKKYSNKNWVFCGRGREYLGGWLEILEAMTIATQMADTLLKEREDQENDRLAKLLWEVQNREDEEQ